MRLSTFATQNIKAIVFVTLALCAVGAGMYTTFPVSILPDVTFPRVVTIASAGDRPARMVEVAVTRPIEEAIATIPNVKRIHSRTERGSTEVSVDFNWGTDIVVAEQLVNARVNQMRPQLPAETTTEVERMNPTVFPVLGLSVNSKTLSQSQLWDLATYALKPRLSRVDGVARIVVQGGRIPELEVVVNPQRLAQSHLSLSDVATAVGQANEIKAVGRMDRQFQRFQVVVTGETVTPAEISRIPVTQKSGVPILLGQIAEVHRSVEDRMTVVSANGKESVLINVVRQPTANTVLMVAAVRKEIDSLKSTLPHGVSVDTYYDQSLLIKDAVQSVQESVLIGGILAVVVLLCFLGDLRATLVTSAIIPATVLITFLLMRMAGLTLNLMTLGALAVGIGLVIDDAIVVVENVFRHMASTSSVREAVQLAAGEIAAPMISSTLTTVVVFLPLSLLQGVAGAFFTALAMTLVIALLVSLALALAVSPSLCAAFLKARANAHEHGRLFERILQGYGRTLNWGLRNRWFMPACAIAAIAVTVGMASKLQTGFMPAMDEGSFVLDYLSPTGTSLEESDRLLQKVDKILQETPEVATFSRRTGTELGFSITESNKGDYAVMLKQNRHRKIDEVMDEVRHRVTAEVPGLDVDFVQVLQDLIGDLAGDPSPIEIKLFGENQTVVNDLGKKIADKLGEVKGLAEIKSGVIESGPEAVVQLDPVRIGRVGLTTDAVSAQADAAMRGNVATQALQGDRQVAVRVRFPAAYRSDPDHIGLIPIQAPGDFTVPLGSLGKIDMQPGSTESYREDQRRMVGVTMRLEGIDLGTGVTRVKKALAAIDVPAGVTVTLGGLYQSQQDSFNNLIAVLGLAILLVFTVMVFQFGSFTAPAVIMAIMPLSLSGAMLSLWVTHTELNVSSFMGAIMLVGIVVKNGILLLDRAQNGERSGLSVEEAVVAAGRQRLRPILMTTLTAILGLVPLALGIGAGAEMQKPLAIAVIGGLTISTMLTLLLGPLLYAMVRRMTPKRNA